MELSHFWESDIYPATTVFKRIYEIRNFITAFLNEPQVHMWKQTKPVQPPTPLI